MGTSLAGLPFTLSLDVKDGAGAVGDGQGIALLIEQGGILYVTTITPSITNDGHAAFDTLNFTGSFAGFGRLDGMAGSPILDGSVATRFGFVAGNTASSPLAMLYDNYSLVVDTPTSTPTSTPSPVTPSPTFTATNTATPVTPSPTSTATNTATPVTPSPTSTATNTATPVTPSPTSTATNTATPVTPSATATATSTGTPTRTPTQTSIIEPPIAPEIPTLDGRALLILIAVLALLAVHRLRAG